MNGTKILVNYINEFSSQLNIGYHGAPIRSGVKFKIFQPFFTTKPTGQVTGLGLSLSYVTEKAHVGELTLNSKQGEASEFIIQLPINHVNHLIQ